jgi:AraC-like DNA-binding protein
MDKSAFRPASLHVPLSPVNDRQRDYALLLASSQSSRDFLTADQPYARGTGLRTDCREMAPEFGRPFGEGYSDFVQLGADLCARVVNARMALPTGVNCPGEDWLKVEVYTSGRQSLVFEDVGQIDLDARWCHMHLHPLGMPKGDWSVPGPLASGLIVYMRPAFVRDRLGESLDRLPPALRSFARDGRGSFMFESLPVSSTMASAVSDVVSTPLIGGLRRLYLESKALQVISSAFGALLQTNAQGKDRLRLSRRDVERLHFVRSIVERDREEPPPIVELARRAGLNQQKLKCGFKILFGMTVFECYRARRLGIAAQMLEDEGASVTEAALAAGYSYPSNFAIAFKRRYGVPPKQLRKRLP